MNNKKAAKIVVSLTLLTIVLYAFPITQALNTITQQLHSLTNSLKAPKKGSTEIVSVYGYPYEDVDTQKASGYIATYYALKKLGMDLHDPREYIKKSRAAIIKLRLENALQKLKESQPTLPITTTNTLKTLHQLYPHEEGLNATARPTGNWLRHEEIEYLIKQGTKDIDKITILEDLGILALPERKDDAHYKNHDKTLQGIGKKIAGVTKDTHVFIADKSYYTTTPTNLWIAIIVNKRNGVIRYAVIDPENEIPQDDPLIKIILNYID